MNEKELKTIKGAKYRVTCNDDDVFSEGAVITLADDPDIDDAMAMYVQEGNSYGAHAMYYHEIELIELPKDAEIHGQLDSISTAVTTAKHTADSALGKVTALEQRVEVLEKACEETVIEIPEPLYTVGQKLRVKGNDNPIHHFYKIGTEVEVKRVNISESGNHSYVTVSVEPRWTQSIAEADLEPLPQPHISEEEFAAIKVGDKIVLRSDLEEGNDYGIEPVTAKMADLAKREVEITVERISADALKGSAEGDSWWYTAEMIAKVIPAIKPKFKVGDVLNHPKDGDSFYYARLITEVDSDNGTYVMRWADGSNPDYRMAYSFDEAESAYIKMEGLSPRMINPKGTVITAGNYYAANGTLYDVVIKVTEVQPENAGWAYIVTGADGRLLAGAFKTVVESAYFATAVPATPEQIEKFKQLENPEHAEEKAPEFDNPEVEVGKVYIDDDGWMFYCDTLSKVTTSNTLYGRIYVEDVTSLNPAGELVLKANYGCNNYREATPEEAIKLLSAAFQDKAA